MFWNGSDTLTLKLDLATGCIDSSQRFEIWELNVLSGSFQLCLPARVLRLAGPPDLERPTCDDEHELHGLIIAIIRGCCSPWAKQGFELMNPALAWGERVNFGFIRVSSAAAPRIWNQIDTANDWNLFRKQLLVPVKTATFLSFIYLFTSVSCVIYWSILLVISFLDFIIKLFGHLQVVLKGKKYRNDDRLKCTNLSSDPGLYMKINGSVRWCWLYPNMFYLFIFLISCQYLSLHFPLRPCKTSMSLI